MEYTFPVLFTLFMVSLIMLSVAPTIQCLIIGSIIIKWKNYRRKRLWPNFKELSQPLPGWTEKNHEKSKLSEPISPCQDSNLGPPEYKARALNYSAMTFSQL
jgi:hypothetical protein